MELGAVDYIRNLFILDALRKTAFIWSLSGYKPLLMKSVISRLNLDVIFKQAPIGIAISYSSGAESMRP